MRKRIPFLLLVVAFVVAIAAAPLAVAPLAPADSPYLSALSNAAVGSAEARDPCPYQMCYNRGTEKHPNFTCRRVQVNAICDLVSSTECYNDVCQIR